jgi:anti-anti-sigma factor
MEEFQERAEASLQLKGALDINSVDDLRGVLLEHLSQHAAITVDLSMIESCDAAGAQLLMALEKSAESAGKPFAILSLSEMLVQDCADLGIHLAASPLVRDAQNPCDGAQAGGDPALPELKSGNALVEGHDAQHAG